MISLFKLLLFFIIAVIWVIALSKKRGQWDEQIPDFPEEPDTSSQETPDLEENSTEGAALPKEEPQEEIFQTKEGIPLPSPYEGEKEPDIAKKEKNKIEFQPELILTQTSSQESPAEQKGPASSSPTSLILKGDLKEGIMWTIILGPARSKVKFNIRNLPVNR